MNAERLESQRLYLKRISLEHVSQQYVDWMNDPQVIEFLESGGNYTMGMLHAYIDEHDKKDIFFWAVHLKTNDKHIGNIKIDPINEKMNSGEYGIMMGDKENWGKGYAKEASQRIIEYCFDTLKLSTITLGCFEENVRAYELYKKIGFEVEEIIANSSSKKNKNSPVIRMSIKNKSVEK